ncbi:2-oxoglutarate dehydrogenase E1 component [Methylobrevis pamukkalensis]|uniref:2-oxoglutarate dehydrogenase E1 component n=1 Tax=Methylobrevis pamukkalensis TaxID=1439726 RepID=A0A1E3H7Y8_9HYPH|nr:2-oxoglutarate dehydrogenase E1 component [Methylobrevis pamukkalensis]
MARQDLNDIFAQTSFLYGGNADYIEELHARYQADPASVDPQWRDFFDALADDGDDVRKSAEGASWERPNWPIAANGDLVAALDGNWAETTKVIEKKLKEKAAAPGAAPASASDIQQAARDSVRAIMMIRAYRMRGHLHANLDPLGLAKKLDHEELHPSSYGFTDATWTAGSSSTTCSASNTRRCAR